MNQHVGRGATIGFFLNLNTVNMLAADVCVLVFLLLLRTVHGGAVCQGFHHALYQEVAVATRSIEDAGITVYFSHAARELGDVVWGEGLVLISFAGVLVECNEE